MFHRWMGYITSGKKVIHWIQLLRKFDAKVQDILSWEGNNFDLTNPQVEPDAMDHDPEWSP